MRAWAIEVESVPGARPHRLDERVLTAVAGAIEADPAAFDADIVGDHDRIRATFDVVAEDAAQAGAYATAVFTRALRAATSSVSGDGETLVDRLVVTEARSTTPR